MIALDMPKHPTTTQADPPKPAARECKVVHVKARVSREQKAGLEEAARAKSESVAVIIREAITEYLKRRAEANNGESKSL
jgi:Ribbon-helix-helix protein, copG family